MLLLLCVQLIFRCPVFWWDFKQNTNVSNTCTVYTVKSYFLVSAFSFQINHSQKKWFLMCLNLKHNKNAFEG